MGRIWSSSGLGTCTERHTLKLICLNVLAVLIREVDMFIEVEINCFTTISSRTLSPNLNPETFNQPSLDSNIAGFDRFFSCLKIHHQ